MRKLRSQAVTSIAILLACCACAFGLDPSLDISQYAHTSWRVRDGFTKGSIDAIAQTPDGYLWLGTESGLVRFDGVRVTEWQPGNGQQLPSDVITRLLSARDGTLWIGTTKGLVSWKGGKLSAYAELSGASILALLQDYEGTVWVGKIRAPSGENLCAIRGGSVQCYGKDVGLWVGSLFEDRTGTLWVGVRDGFWRWKPGLPQFFPVLGGGTVRIEGEDERGPLIGARDALKRLIGNRVEPYYLPGAPRQFVVRRMLRDRDGRLWIGTDQRGLLHIHRGRTDAFSEADGLSGDVVNDLCEDREGNIWAATANGLDRFRDYGASTISTKQGLSRGVPWSVLASKDGDVWIGAQGALSQWEDGRLSLFASGRRAHTSDGKLNGESPNSLFQDSSGRIWVSTAREFGYLDKDRFVAIPGFPAGNVPAIAEGEPGHLWVLQLDAGLLHVFGDKVVERIPWTGLGHKEFAFAVSADPSRKGLWLGFRNAVAYFAGGSIKKSYSVADGLAAGRVNELRFGSRGALWAATEGGLSRIKDGHLQTLTRKNGLPCDTVHWSTEDDDHSAWLFMPCGLVRVGRSELDAWVADPTKKLKTTLFDNSDGVRLRGFPGGFTPRVAKSADGKLWFFSYDGVSVIDPHNLHENKLPPPVHIEKIIADDKPYDATNGMRLPARVHYLAIDYTALTLVVPEKVHFRYKLEGLDKDWREVVNDREVQYTNLAPKHYRFRVLACNNSGVWNEEGASLDFVIPPMWYQTNWFYALCAAAFLGSLWAAYQLRVRQLAAEFNMRLDERVAERTRIARDLHDTLLQSFQGLVFRFQAALNQLPGRPEKAQEVLESALGAADQAIAEGRGAIQELRSGPSHEGNLEQMLLEMGRELASPQNGGDSGPPLRVIVEGSQRAKRKIIREEIFRIARELLRNAYRHAQAKSIEVELRYDDDAFLLIVRDDGKGIDSKVLKDRGRAGHWGLPGMYERAEGIGARLDIWSEAGAGTEVRLTVPAAIAYEKSGDRGKFKLFGKTGIYERRS